MPLSSGELMLDEPESRYVSKVHRLGPGDRFMAFDPVQRVEAEARITEVGRRVRCVAAELAVVPLPSHDVRLVYALAKGDKLELVVRDATALGVTRVVLAESERSVVRLEPARGTERVRRLQAVAVASARLCGRGDLPAIDGPLPLAAALERAGDGAELKVLLHTADVPPIARVLERWSLGTSIALAVGPEGGFAPAELELAEARGFVAASLGPLTLRTETAVVAALAVVLARVQSRA